MGTLKRDIHRRVIVSGVAAALLVGLVIAPAVHPATAYASDIANFTTVYGTDVVQAGFGGMRDNGIGTLTVSGVSGTVTKALLYWHGPTNSTDPAANAAVTFAGNAVTGTNIGFSSDNCWSYANSQAYRADVTTFVTGNGSYSLAGFVKDSGAINVNGASLIVFFDDGNAANNRDVVLFDGNDSNKPNAFDANGWNVSLPGINYVSGTANITMHVSDGQSYPDDALVLNGSTLVPAGAIFQGDSVPFGSFDNNGHLWDIKSFDVTSFLSPGPNTLTLTTGYLNDCLSLVVAAIDLPAGAAPPTPAHLTLAKTVDNTGGGAALATAWTLNATGPTTISGHTGGAAITNAAVNAGTYTLAESGGPTGYTPSAWSCTGGTLTGSSLVLAAGDTASCSITNTFIVQQVPTGGIYPTNTSCQDFLAGAPLLPGINYTVQNGKIAQNINPGVFFYFSEITVTAGELVTTSQTSSSGSALFVLNNGHAWAWTANCLTKVNMTPSANGTTASYTFPTAGTYILQLQYQTKSIAQTAAPVPANPTYSFDTNTVVNGTIQLFKQN